MSISPVQLNFINQSSDSNNSTIVIFQKNAAMPENLSVAWRVLHDTFGGEPYAVSYTPELWVNAIDSQGFETGRVVAQAVQKVVDQGTGIEIPVDDESPKFEGDELLVSNGLAAGTLTVQVFRDDLVVAQATVAAGATAKFKFVPTLWLGLAPAIEEGSIISAAVQGNALTQLNLLGIISADVVMTGVGSNGEPVFELKNVVATA